MRSRRCGCPGGSSEPASPSLAGSVRAGITTLDLDREAETFIRDHNCIPGFLGFEGFPNSLCVSINEQVVHGIPGPQVIEDGDLVSLDCGLIRDGWWADSGLSVACGEGSPEVRRLIDATREALNRGIAAARPDQRIPHGFLHNIERLNGVYGNTTGIPEQFGIPGVPQIREMADCRPSLSLPYRHGSCRLDAHS